MDIRERLFSRLRPNADQGPDEGWLSVLAVLAAVVVVAAALEEARWLRRLPSFYTLTVIAAIVAMVLTRYVRSGWIAGILLAVSGVVLSVLTAAKAWPSFPLIASNVRYIVLTFIEPDQVPPVVVSLPLWMLDRLRLFAQSLSIGQENPSVHFIALMIFLTLWAIAAWAGWAAFRYHRSLQALLPAGCVLAANIFFSSGQAIWLVPFMMALVVLAVRLRQYRLVKNWETNDIDYSPEFRVDLYLNGLFMAATVAAIMVLMPNLRLAVVSRAFWDVFDQPYDVLEAQVERFLPDLDRTPRGLVDQGVMGRGGLPRSHLIGDPPELSDRVAMTVRTSDQDPLRNGASVNYRWRAVTFSEYDGRSWGNPADMDTERVAPGEVWQAQALQSRRMLQQRFEVTAGHTFWLYGIAEPIASDRVFQAHLRGSADALGFEVNARDYTVISQVPNVSESDLSAVSPLSDDIPAVYLAVPESVPDRVFELTEELTQEAQTPYDQARAIESYLRTYPYDLDVPDLPPGVDVADYFLFELQKGYCDYYATSMVVMARSLGLPARLAVGFAAGEYDQERQHFTVVEADAHSWPEIYFPDYGWIPFEPTAAQPVYVRQPLGTETEVVEQDTIDLASQLAQLRRQSWLLYGAWRWLLPLFALLMLVLALRFIWRDWRLRRQAANPWQLAYLRLEAWGDRLDVPPAPWRTPREYARLWRSRLGRSDDATASAGTAAAEITQLSEALEQRAYAPVSARPDDKAANPLWRRLRSHLWRLWWGQRFRKTSNNED
jgi:transglutaminase-like putative cysteine protease